MLDPPGTASTGAASEEIVAVGAEERSGEMKVGEMMKEGPRFTLESTGAETVKRVIHTMSNKTVGVVVHMIQSGSWCYVCPKLGCKDRFEDYRTPEDAAVALGAHVLDHRLTVARASLPGEVA